MPFAQDLKNLGGKILRMNLDGSIPDDNPFPASYVYSYGHRNPQGFAWNEDGTILYSSEHGSSAHDEINLIEPGKNYGWPEINGDEVREGMKRPLLHSGNDTWAPSGIAFWEEHLFVAGLAGQCLYVYNESEGSLDVVFTSGERLRYVYPYEEDLYVITNSTSPRETGPSDGGRLLRLRPLQ
jgi:glucose/arabinose dehydrogenase